MFAQYGRAMAESCITFVSAASLDSNLAQTLGLSLTTVNRYITQTKSFQTKSKT